MTYISMITNSGLTAFSSQRLDDTENKSNPISLFIMLILINCLLKFILDKMGDTPIRI